MKDDALKSLPSYGACGVTILKNRSEPAGAVTVSTEIVRTSGLAEMLVRLVHQGVVRFVAHCTE